MTFTEAQILIKEAHKLGYHGTEWERGFIDRLTALQPARLTPGDSMSITEFYRRATGGGMHEPRQIIAGKHRYNPEKEV